jgi:hypothetical protein
MRRSASEIIRNLQMRIARLERQANKLISQPTTTSQLFKVVKGLKGQDREGITTLYLKIFRALDKQGLSPKKVVIESLEITSNGKVLVFSVPSMNIKDITLTVSKSNTIEYNGRSYSTGSGGVKGIVSALELIIYDEAEVLSTREEASRLKSEERVRHKEEDRLYRLREERREERREEEEEERREEQAESLRRSKMPPTPGQIKRKIESLDRYHNVTFEGANLLEIDLSYREKDDYTEEDIENQNRTKERFEKDLLNACPNLKKYWDKNTTLIIQDKGFLDLIFDKKYMSMVR